MYAVKVYIYIYFLLGKVLAVTHNRVIFSLTFSSRCFIISDFYFFIDQWVVKKHVASTPNVLWLKIFWLLLTSLILSQSENISV